jgi:hypothetical protein
LKLKDRIEFDNAVKVLGVADNAGSYTMKDEFGNTFRSFFIACDVQDLLAAGYYSQKVRIDHNILFYEIRIYYFYLLFLLSDRKQFQENKRISNEREHRFLRQRKQQCCWE